MTLQDLLAGDRQPAEREQVEIPRELLADLYDHPVIITPEYIGRDRRTFSPSEGTGRTTQLVTVDRRVPAGLPVGPNAQYGDHTGLRASRSLGTFEALVIVVSTLALAVPLTLMAASGNASAIASTPAAPHVASAITGSSGLRTAALQQTSDRAARRAARVEARARAARSRSLRRAAVARHEAAMRTQHRHEVALRRAQAERKHKLLARERAASRAARARRDRTRRY
jgi:hypothetical protein